MHMVLPPPSLPPLYYEAAHCPSLRILSISAIVGSMLCIIVMCFSLSRPQT